VRDWSRNEGRLADRQREKMTYLTGSSALGALEPLCGGRAKTGVVDNVKWYGRVEGSASDKEEERLEVVKPRGVSESKSNRFQVLSRDCRDVVQGDQAFLFISRQRCATE